MSSCCWRSEGRSNVRFTKMDTCSQAKRIDWEWEGAPPAGPVFQTLILGCRPRMAAPVSAARLVNKPRSTPM